MISQETAIKKLTKALLVSCFLNVLLLTLFFYFAYLKKPSLAWVAFQPLKITEDLTGSLEDTIGGLKDASLETQLINLRNKEKIDQVYSIRDVALAILITKEEFDLEKALKDTPKPLQEREVIFETERYSFFPGLTEDQFESIVRFASQERWPITSKGLFLKLKSKGIGSDRSLVDAFLMSEEFAAVDLLFQRHPHPPSQEKILQMLLEGDFSTLDSFVTKQKLALDLSAAQKERFLLDYVALGSPTAHLFLKPMLQKQAVVPPNVHTSKQKVHIVQQGDSLWKIARRYHVEMQSIRNTNKLANDLLKPGTLLYIDEPSR